MSGTVPSSPNFQFLAKHDPVLVRHAALAERYVFDDANSALIKLRQFGELLSQCCAATVGMVLEPRDSFLDILNRLRSGGVIDYQVANLFHGLRKIGNEAAHGSTDDRRAALHQLQMARKLAVWFHKVQADGRLQPPEQSFQGELETILRDIADAMWQAA